MTRISAILAVRDGERYLREAVDSMLGQTRAPDEVIVVDDGSTDGTRAILESYGSRLRLLTQANQGQGGALAAGLAVATGDLIAFQDADDVWSADKLEKQGAVLASDSQADAIFGMCEQFVSPELGADDQARFAPPVAIMAGEVAQAMLARRTSFERFGGIDRESRGAWFLIWLGRAKAGGMRSAVLPDIVHRRRLHLSNYGRLNPEERDRHHLSALRRNILRARGE
ncbi:MAG TPA: glycosyltransferase family A protein [Devosia sp.]|nr:glycosyltransferase family A protein [Devosia sp.]